MTDIFLVNVRPLLYPFRMWQRWYFWQADAPSKKDKTDEKTSSLINCEKVENSSLLIWSFSGFSYTCSLQSRPPDGDAVQLLDTNLSRTLYNLRFPQTAALHSHSVTLHGPSRFSTSLRRFVFVTMRQLRLWSLSCLIRKVFCFRCHHILISHLYTAHSQACTPFMKFTLYFQMTTLLFYSKVCDKLKHINLMTWHVVSSQISAGIRVCHCVAVKTRRLQSLSL